MKQVPVLKPAFQETTCMGAAIAAGIAAGMWTPDDVFSGTGVFARGAEAPPRQQGDTAAAPQQSAQEVPTASVLFTPEVSVSDTERRYGHWKKAVSRSLQLADMAT